MDVGFDDRGVHTKPVALHHAFLMSDAHKPRMDLLDHLCSERCAPPPHRLGIRHLAGAHARKVAVNEIGAHLPLQHPIAPIAYMLEDQKPQHGLGCNTLPAATAALGVALRQRLVHSAHDLLVRQNLVGMLHPRLTKIADFPGNQPIAKAELSTAHLNHRAPLPVGGDSQTIRRD